MSFCTHHYNRGANLPTLNELLQPYEITFGNGIYDGTTRMKGNSFRYGSGTSLIQFPKGGEVFYTNLNDQAGNILSSSHDVSEVGILGL